jgi:hypothetical protein
MFPIARDGMTQNNRFRDVFHRPATLLALAL